MPCCPKDELKGEEIHTDHEGNIENIHHAVKRFLI
jgi:hypothetical protein